MDTSSVFKFSQILCQKPSFDEMVLESRAFERWWGNEGGALWMGLMLLEKRSHRALQSFPSCEDAVRNM